jgi:hypothetical protein
MGRDDIPLHPDSRPVFFPHFLVDFSAAQFDNRRRVGGHRAADSFGRNLALLR